MDEKELKPCPFCSGNAYFERLGTGRQSCIVECGSCGIRHESGDEGVMCGNSWNHRPALPSDAAQAPCTECGGSTSIRCRSKHCPQAASAPIYQARWIGDGKWRDMTHAEFIAERKTVGAEDQHFRTLYAAPVAPAAAAPSACEVLKAALTADKDYAWSWHCNLAMAFYDSMPQSPDRHRLANEGAARFMWAAFGLEIKETDYWKAIEREWKKDAAAQPDERAAFEAKFPLPGGVNWDGAKYVVRDGYENSYPVERFGGQWEAWQARATAPQAKFECAARKQGSVGGNDPADCDWPLCGCDEHANKVIGALEESGALKGTPIYQIGANAGGGIAWWDVDKDRYEREKKAGFMKTCIVYREGK